jgi:hypothetical protein
MVSTMRWYASGKVFLSLARYAASYPPPVLSAGCRCCHAGALQQRSRPCREMVLPPALHCGSHIGAHCLLVITQLGLIVRRAQWDGLGRVMAVDPGFLTAKNQPVVRCGGQADAVAVADPWY